MANNLQMKKNLSPEQMTLVSSEFSKRQKSKGIAFALWFFFGILGAHRFYTRNTGIALGQLFTLGGFGIWSFIDVFFISKAVERVNEDIERAVITEVTLS